MSFLRPYRPRLLAALVPTVGGASLAIFLLAIKAMHTSSLAYSAIFGLTLALGLASAAYAMRESTLEGEAVALASTTFLGWAPSMIAGAAAAIDMTVAGGGPSPDTAVLAAGVFALLLFAGSFIVPLVDVAGLGRAATRVVRPVLAAGFLLVAASTVRAVSRPDPDHWLERIATVAEAPVGGELDVRGRTLVHVRRVEPEAPVPVSAYELHPAPRAMGPPRMVERCLLETKAGEYVRASSCKTMELAHDPRTDLWVLREPGSTYASSPCVFRDRPCDDVTITARSLAKGVAPPAGWTWGAAGGMALAFVAFAGARRRSRAAGAALGIDATHIGEGRFRLADFQIISVPSAAAAPLGSVRIELPSDASDYRTSPHAGARYVGPDDVDTVRRRLEVSAGGASLAAVAIVLVTAAPLFVAAVCGLVF